MEIIPYDKRSGKIWFNGENIDWSKAQVHLLSHGLHYASLHNANRDLINVPVL
jgi:branched-chain amino acid aminotransferase